MNNFRVIWSHFLPERPEILLRDCIIVLFCLVAGRIAMAVAKSVIIRNGVERYLRLPWAAAPAESVPLMQRARPAKQCSAVTSAVGWFCMLSVWALAIIWISWLDNYRWLADSARFVLGRGWQAGFVIFVAILASGWLAHTLYGLLQTPWLKRELDALFTNSGGVDGSFSETAARAMCVVVYVAFLLFVPVIIAGLFNLPALSGLAGPAWQMCSRLFTAVVSFAIGYLGLAWIRSQSKLPRKEGVDHSEFEYYVQLGIMIVTTLVALSMIVGASSGIGLIGILILMAIGCAMVWPMRAQIRDLWCGLLLRLQDAKSLILNGEAVEVKAFGPLVSTIVRNGQEETRRNACLLDAVVKGAEKPHV